MKKSIASGLTILFILTILVGCNNTSALNSNENPTSNPSSNQENAQEVQSPNALVPSIMIEGTLYLMSQKENLVIEVPENDYLGRIGSTVPLSEWPTENEQANIDVEDAPYAEYGNGIVVLWNGEWTLFLTEQERLLEE
jgi:hypothetical protein